MATESSNSRVTRWLYLNSGVKKRGLDTYIDRYNSAMVLTEITSTPKISDSEIRLRAEHSSLGKYTHHFIGYSDNQEIGFVSADLREDIDAFVLYEIFVPSTQRKKGVGAELLHTAELLASKRGFGRVFVYPRAFEEQSASELERRTRELIEWYKRLGYSPRPDLKEELFKPLRADEDGCIHL
jgi:GNAT superfamily N-acetyltransferase